MFLYLLVIFIHGTDQTSGFPEKSLLNLYFFKKFFRKIHLWFLFVYFEVFNFLPFSYVFLVFFDKNPESCLFVINEYNS